MSCIRLPSDHIFFPGTYYFFMAPPKFKPHAQGSPCDFVVLRLRRLWVRFFVDLHKYRVPRFIAEAPQNNYILWMGCSILISDSKVSNCGITTLTHYKEKKIPYREFMLAVMVIDCDGTPCTINLRIERLVKEENIRTSSWSDIEPSLQDVVSISGRSGHDFVSREPCKVIETMTFTLLLLYDFCRLLSLLNDVRPSNQDLNHQCY